MLSAKEACFTQFGCGLCAPRWLDFDSSPAMRLQRLPILENLFLYLLDIKHK